MAVVAQMTEGGSNHAADERVTSYGTPSELDHRAGTARPEETRLDAALANIPHGLCMFDADKRLVLSNSRYAEMYSLPPWLVAPGTPLESIVEYRRQIGNAPVDFPAYASHEGIEFKQEGNSLFEFELADGRTIRINHLVLKDGGYVATHEDVTDAVRSEGRFRSIFNAISEGIFILDATSGAFIEINEPGYLMLGYKADELIGSDFQTLSSGAKPYTESDARGWMEKAAASRQPQRFAWQSRTKDGRVLPVEVSMRFALIGGEEVVLAIMRDLSERQVIEAQLRQSQKMEAVGQLTGGMAHDFNNLLGVIIGNLDLIRDTGPLDPRIDELVGQALEAALGGADLTRRLLAFARRQPLQPVRIDLKELVARTVKLLARVLGENIEISVELGEGDCFVIADATQLEAALTNLATNARDAMPRGGRLLISTGRRGLDADYAASNRDVTPGEYAVIEVTDTGVGMPPEVIGKIFDPFFTTKEVGKGTGLGLCMVFGFLKQSGGHITVYSEVGVGTTFRLYLPRVEDGGTAEAPAQPAALSSSKGEMVLVVEDNTALRRTAVRQLRELGYRVLDVQNGAEALAQLEANAVDLLFTDIVMPAGMDGFELANTAKARWPDLKVILTSGYPERKVAESLATVNFPLLTKPYRRAALAQILREVLDDTRG